MRILLTLPYDARHKWESPDLGLGYLAALLRQDGHSVELMLRPGAIDFAAWLRKNRFSPLSWDALCHRRRG